MSHSSTRNITGLQKVNWEELLSQRIRWWSGRGFFLLENKKIPAVLSFSRVRKHNNLLCSSSSAFCSPRPSRPASHAGDSRRMEKPVQTGQESGSTSGLAHKAAAAGSITPAGSRPPSVLLKEALSLLFNVDT